MKHYEFEISMFLDDELSDDLHKEMFLHISECRSCRNFLFRHHKLLLETKNEINKELNNIICENDSDSLRLVPDIDFKSIKSNNLNLFYKAGFYTSIAASVFILILTISVRNNTITIPVKELHTDTLYVPQIIKETNYIPYRRSSSGEMKYSVKSANNNIISKEYLASIPSIKITESDLLIPEKGGKL
jgi:hypothetical protein